jgi:tRNA 2-thiouridine synthesizing protein D
MVGERKKSLTIMLFTGPYSSQYADHMCRIADRALDKSYGVQIFLYGDGVHSQLTGQNPKVFFNVGEALTKLAEKGAVIKSCVRCSTARGYVEGEFDEKEGRYPSSKAIDAVKIYSLYGYVEMLGSTDRAITLGSSN